MLYESKEIKCYPFPLYPYVFRVAQSLASSNRKIPFSRSECRECQSTRNCCTRVTTNQRHFTGVWSARVRRGCVLDRAGTCWEKGKSCRETEHSTTGKKSTSQGCINVARQQQRPGPERGRSLPFNSPGETARYSAHPVGHSTHVFLNASQH